MKTFFPLIFLMLIATTVSSQENKKETDGVKTKMDEFSSRTGVIVKFIDTKLPAMKTSYGGAAETRIRKITSGNGNGTYFYQIVKEGKYNNSTASIEYSDLLEVIKAFKVLKTEAEKDANSEDYLETKFTTTDGFQLGYFISKNKASWFLRLEKYGTDNTLFIDKAETLELAFEEAKMKIEELRK